MQLYQSLGTWLYCGPGGGGGGGDSRIKMTGVLVVLVPFRVFSFKASSVVVFVVPVRVEIM